MRGERVERSSSVRVSFSIKFYKADFGQACNRIVCWAPVYPPVTATGLPPPAINEQRARTEGIDGTDSGGFWAFQEFTLQGALFASVLISSPSKQPGSGSILLHKLRFLAAVARQTSSFWYHRRSQLRLRPVNVSSLLSLLSCFGRNTRLSCVNVAFA